MKKAFLLIVFLCTVAFIFAQTDIKFTNSNFPGRSKEVSDAKNAIKTGDNYLDVKNYATALSYYKKAQTLNPNNSELNFKIGLCVYNSLEKTPCLEYFEKAWRLNKNVDKQILFYLGRAYQFNYFFAKALNCYNDYLHLCKDSEEKVTVKRYIKEAENGILLMQDTVEVEIVNLGEAVNSKYSDYNAQVSSDGTKLYFTSRRAGTTGGRVYEDGYPFEDIYESTFIDGAWTKAKNIGKPINTNMNDAISGLSPDGQTMYIYKDVSGGGDIFVSRLNGNRWQTPKSISSNINSPAHETNSCLTADNKTLYFISNGFDTRGNHDIFYSTAVGNGWSKPKNLGSIVNTKDDERAVFIHPDGRTLYFSSNGHKTMGGYDIFKTVKDENGNWSEPENLGYPINSPFDDIFFSITASGKKAYYTSIREGGYGMHDLYELRFPDKTKKQNESKVLVTLVKGIIKDAATLIPIEAKIEITDNSKNEVITTFKSNSITGEYIVNLASGKNYGLSINKEGYLFHSENFNLADTADFKEVEINILLNKAQVGTSIILKNIFFDYNKSTLQAASHAELDRLVEILVKQKELQIEIGGHTDNVGSIEYNKKLSTDRAKAVFEYLTSHGISDLRITYKGYGFEKPIATNDNEEGRQQNRRVEFKIVGTNK